jgi:peptide/nickel transport system substrate-binding protein
MMDRRRFLQATAAGALLACARLREARALGRVPAFGKIAFALPWPLTSIDPHDLFDPAAALFGASIADTVFALDASGAPYPTLASDMPAAQAKRTVLRLREGLVSARGRSITARDLVFSIRRARQGRAGALWGDIPAPVAVPSDPLAIAFDTGDSGAIARALASPLFAFVPVGFSPQKPDGTGAFLADLSAGRLVLTRNPHAARGASFLDQVTVDHAVDLSASLRAFERNATDIGWLGSGLHTPRPAAVPFERGAAAWVVLQTGAQAGTWGAPGIAQQIADGLPPERLQHLGLGSRPAATGSAEWGGNPCDLYVQEGAAQLEELARIVASLISRPGHEVAPRPISAADLSKRRAASAFSLLVGIVRPVGPPGPATLVALTAADDPQAARGVVQRPPRLAGFDPRLLTRTLRLGVIGELRLSGSHAPDVHLARSASGNGWDLGSSFRSPPP